MLKCPQGVLAGAVPHFLESLGERRVRDSPEGTQRPPETRNLPLVENPLPESLTFLISPSQLQVPGSRTAASLEPNSVSQEEDPGLGNPWHSDPSSRSRGLQTPHPRPGAGTARSGLWAPYCLSCSSCPTAWDPRRPRPRGGCELPKPTALQPTTLLLLHQLSTQLSQKWVLAEPRWGD